MCQFCTESSISKETTSRVKWDKLSEAHGETNMKNVEGHQIYCIGNTICEKITILNSFIVIIKSCQSFKLIECK